MTPFGVRFGRTVAAFPDRVAATDHSGRSVTYGELYSAATALGRQLAERSVGHALVALRGEVDLVVALSGALMAGVAFVPLELRQNHGYLAEVAARFPDAVMVCGRETVAVADTIGPHEQLLVPDERIPPVAPDHEAGAGPVAAAAYVLFTSGSTGSPKAVRVSQCALLGYLDWVATFAPAVQRGAIAHSSIMFDFSLPALLAPLLWGGQVHLVPDEQALIDRLSGGEPVGLLRLTPSHIHALHEFFSPDRPMPAAAVLVGGEVLTWSHVRALRSVLRPGTPIWNQWGPTETVIGATVHNVADSAEAAGDIPIGRPRPGTRVSVVDERLRPVAAGTVGELVVSGGIADGYLEPVPGADPFLDHPEWGRIYRTGDFGFLGTDGLLRFSGRRDGQVKIRGHRVEMGAVEAALVTVAGVSDVSAYLEPLGVNGSRLAVGVALDAGADHGRVAADIARAAVDRLPDYARPAVVRHAATLPRGVNGKRDFAAMATLPPLRAERLDAGADSAAEVCTQLSGIFSDVLGVTMTSTDDFFMVGGDSIALLRVVARARRAGLRLAITDVYAAPTAHKLAERVAGKVGRS